MPYITQVAVGLRDKLNIFGNDYPTKDGTGVRDYIHVMDLAEGHLQALAYTFSHTGTEAFNLGTGTGYSVLQLVQSFETTTKQSIPYKFTERRPGDIASCYADIILLSGNTNMSIGHNSRSFCYLTIYIRRSFASFCP